MDNWIEAIIPSLTLEDLPDSYREVAFLIGIENAVKLSRGLGGLAYYFPQINALLRKKRDELIRKEFNGRNHRDLAKKYGLTEAWIRNIVDKKPDAQTPLF